LNRFRAGEFPPDEARSNKSPASRVPGIPNRAGASSPEQLARGGPSFEKVGFSWFAQKSESRRRAAVAAALLLAALANAPQSRATPRSNWAIDPARTRISFSIDAIGYPRTQGEFHHFDGRISVDFDHPAQSRVSFRVDARSVDVGSASFGDYLRSPAFLDATRFGQIVFSSTAVEKVEDHLVRVTGDLTMLGVTRPLTVDVEVRRPPEAKRLRLEFTARAKIDRLEFGMNSGFPIISRDVDLTVASEAAEQ
jgi:polyisoprenoid-binding protein YceI